MFNDLFEDYSNALRPVEDTDKVLNVTLQITLSQIKDMVSTQSRNSLACCLNETKSAFQRDVLTGNLRGNENRQLCVRAGERRGHQAKEAFYEINFTECYLSWPLTVTVLDHLKKDGVTYGMISFL